MGRKGDPERVSPRAMLKRVYGFLALWLALLLVLPIAWFGAAVALWLALLTPGIIEIHRQFQNEPDPY